MATLTTLVTAPLTGISEANGINDAGTVVGKEDDQFPFIWRPQQPNGTTGTPTQLPTLPAPIGTATAMSINVNDDVVGFGDATDPSGNTVTRAILWKGGGIRDLGTLSVDANGNFLGTSRAADINDAGVVVGRAETPNGTIHAFALDTANPNAKMLDLGTLPQGNSSRATSINNNDDIVGVSDTVDANGNVVQRAFLIPNGGAMTELGTLIPDPANPGQFLQNSVAFGINDNGRIAGKSETGGTAPDGNPFAIACEFAAGSAPTGLMPVHSEAFDIGPNNHIVGHFELPIRGFMIQLPTSSVDLTTLVATPGTTIIDAGGVNASGQIVATADLGATTVGVLITP